MHEDRVLRESFSCDIVEMDEVPHADEKFAWFVFCVIAIFF